MRRVAVIGGCRTPFVRAGGALSQYSFLDLGAHVLSSVVKRLSLDSAAIEEVIFGTVLLDPRAPNWARETVFKAGLPHSVNAHAISNNCISGLVAVNMLAEAIRSGRVSLGLAGGSESMSRPTLTLRHSAEKFFLKLARARTMPDKIKALASFKFSHLLPQAPSPKEPSTGLTMGEHCEIMAKEFGISRAAQDALALQSHQHAAAAQSKGYLAEEIASLPGIDKDNIIRGDTTIERLSKLPAVFDRSPAGTLSAGNSSALTDGASVVCLMAEDRAKIEGRAILGYIEETEFAAISPKDGLLMAPAVAVPNLMKRAGLRIADIDLFEIHEAFAAQVLCNMHAWERGWSKYPAAQAIGVIPPEKVNVNGGSLALGHPFAATGGRLILAALSELRRRGKSKAAISVCAAGAMGCAMLVSSR